MTDILKPRDGKDVEDAVRWALAGDKALELVGRGSKRALGRPSQTDLTLDLSGLAGVTLYEPAELVLSARAGTPLAEIEKLLADNNQQLGFEPMDYGPLLGGEAGDGQHRRRHRRQSLRPAPRSRPAPRATTSSASPRSPAAPRPSSRAGAWSRTSPATTCANCSPAPSARSAP